MESWSQHAAVAGTGFRNSLSAASGLSFSPSGGTARKFQFNLYLKLSTSARRFVSEQLKLHNNVFLICSFVFAGCGFVRDLPKRASGERD
jgi:hypothetical protein